MNVPGRPSHNGSMIKAMMFIRFTIRIVECVIAIFSNSLVGWDSVAYPS